MSISLADAKERAKSIVEETFDRIKEEVGDDDPGAIDQLRRAVCVGLANYKES